MEVPPEKIYDLFNHCFDFAKSMLQEAGMFYPFGAVLTPDLEMNAVGADLGDAQPEPSAVYQLLSQTFSEQAQQGKIAASALACDVNIPEKLESPVSDGLRVHLESSGMSRYVYVPYQIEADETDESARTVTFFDPITVDLQPHIF
ncbi:hypothetical protein [Gimesia panareensis]|uniref:Uncharacterized protein n=1 Tax=Gimesia panareensis TaxID=2527978 RepID=A0A518A934_9PLAN|nr:hypothetical protein [Gimesia panareensis]QDT28361.1 hypothetical protein Enr10x_37030 [Gimesia panareensis]QDU51229.1 hypothetical protein Pan110_35930 [Gimesia panareensis]